MKYVDTNIFISAIAGEAKNHAQEILNKFALGEKKAATSLITWDEFVWSLRKYLSPAQIHRESKMFLLFPHITFFDLNSEIVGKAHLLVEKYNLRPRDALHAATALCNGITEIISDDVDFDKIKELKRIPLKYALK